MKGTMFALLFVAIVVSNVAGQDQRTLDERRVADANNEFTAGLYNELRRIKPDENLLFSPFSLSSAMAMVKAGARGSTANEIQRGMRYPEDETLFNGYSALLESLKSNENFTLETANRVYTQAGFKLNPKYEGVLRDSFGAKAEQLDFSRSAEAAQSINGWVEGVTMSKIKNLVSSEDFDALTRLVLVNAIYFKGLWANKFDPEATRKAPFYVSPTKNVSVDMMKSESDYPFVDLTQELDAKAVALPYKGNRLSMIVLLPNKIDGLAELESRLKSFKISDIPSRMRSRKVTLSMPKFKLETTIDLSQTLQDLGMKSMFGDAADFSGIPDPSNPEQLKMSKAVQKCFLEVNEEGSEAAAATGSVMMARAFIEYPKFKVDHPFVFHIISYERMSSSSVRSNRYATKSGRSPNKMMTHVNILFSGALSKL